MAVSKTKPFSSAFIKKATMLFGVILLFFNTSSTQAQLVPAASPCDPKYMDSLESRAWLEAQREITQNQNLIFKPDSVLEYTCFDLFLGELAEHAKDMFSENTRWGTILPVNSMDGALEALVGRAFRTYLTDNFELTLNDDGETVEYDLLGGRASPRVELSEDDPNLDYDEDTPWLSPVLGDDLTEEDTAYNCNMMNRVWMAAKCMNFIDVPGEDGFFTFEQYQSAPDKRFLPQRCEAIPTQWETNIRLAWVDQYTTWIEDNMQTYLERLDPDNCSTSIPQPTGLMLQNSQYPNGYPEFVCIPPGCHYTPNAGCS